MVLSGSSEVEGLWTGRGKVSRLEWQGGTGCRRGQQLGGGHNKW